MNQSAQFMLIMGGITIIAILVIYFIFKYYFGKKLKIITNEINEKNKIFRSEIEPILTQWKVDRDSGKALEAAELVFLRIKDEALKKSLKFIMDALFRDDILARNSRDY